MLKLTLLQELFASFLTLLFLTTSYLRIALLTQLLDRSEEHTSELQSH